MERGSLPAREDPLPREVALDLPNRSVLSQVENSVPTPPFLTRCPLLSYYVEHKVKRGTGSRLSQGYPFTCALILTGDSLFENFPIAYPIPKSHIERDDNLSRKY